MKKETHDYLNAELDFLHKAYEIQFTHFMGVFYFWTVLVTAPVTAGLLNTDANMKSSALPIILLLVAIVGSFITIKMFDIRCSQLKYISMMNEVRSVLYKNVKGDLPKNYEHPFPATSNLQKTALTDFGMIMAFIMSILNAVFFGFAISPFLQNSNGFNWCGFIIFGVFGFAFYFYFVFSKVPRPTKAQ